MHKLESIDRKASDDLYANYTRRESPHARIMRDLVVRTIQPFVRGGVAMQLGASDRYMTEMLSRSVDRLDVVGSESTLRAARQIKLPNVSHASFYERDRPIKKYDYVFAVFVLEHVEKVSPVLAKARSRLKEDGLLFVVVPNALALSRQLARNMGLLDNLKDLTAEDIATRRRRMYDRPDLNRELEGAGFLTVSQGGLLLKILDDVKLDKLIDMGMLQAQHIEGLYKLGFEYPDLCAALFSVCKMRRGVKERR